MTTISEFRVASTSILKSNIQYIFWTNSMLASLVEQLYVLSAPPSLHTILAGKEGMA